MYIMELGKGDKARQNTTGKSKLDKQADKLSVAPHCELLASQ